MGARDERFWAGFLGVAAGDWSGEGVTVRPHVGLAGYLGFWCFLRHRRLVISAPPSWVTRLHQLAADVRAEELMQSGFWARMLGADFERAIGPAFQGCLEPERFQPKPSGSVRLVVEADAAEVEKLRAACGEDCGLAEAKRWRYGYFEGGGMTAMAGYRDWDDEAGDPCVMTRPDARSSGRGAAVTSAVVAAALSAGRLLLYQTLEANEPAVRLARSLGYERYGSHLAVRLRRDTPS